jgi:di/tricarboxylate transporter
MFGMSWQAWLTLGVLGCVFVVLQRRKGTPVEVLFLGALVVVTITGVISPKEALSGFANTGVITIGALYVAAAGLRQTGVLDWVGHRLLGRVRNEISALRRLALFEVSLSAFVPNTPVVVLLVPVVVDWCRRWSISPSKLLLPVSYLAVLGGVCSLIGTSTNIVVHGLLSEKQEQLDAAARDQALDVYQQTLGPAVSDPRFRRQLGGMTLFEIGNVGIPCALAGAAFLVFFGRRLLPNRTDLIQQLGEQRREYLVEMLVQPGCRLIGQSVEAAGLRHLPGLFLIEIDREGELITPVTPQDVIHAHDRLIFTGVVTTIIDLEKIGGLVPAADRTYEVNPKRRQGRHLTEVVLSASSPLIGTTVRKANFRQLYNAAVVAVHRNGARMTNKIGDIELQPGDTLLLQTRTEFAEAWRHSQDFYLVSRVEGTRPRRNDKAWVASLLFVVMVVWMGFEGIDLHPSLAGFGSAAVAATTIACLMVVTRCLPAAEARAAVDLQVYLTLAAAFGMGKALEASGAADGLARLLEGLVGPDRPWLLLLSIYVSGIVVTEFLSNSAAAAILFPLAVAVAASAGLSPRPFVMGVALASSLSFLTPIGYQTNLMVMGPGGYLPSDFVRVGAPLTLIVTLTALSLIPWVWPFAL